MKICSIFSQIGWYKDHDMAARKSCLFFFDTKVNARLVVFNMIMMQSLGVELLRLPHKMYLFILDFAKVTAW